MTTEVIFQKIKSLSINLQFYLEQFLFEESEGLNSGDTRDRLRRILDLIILLMKESPDGDTATALLYNFSIVIKGMFEQHPEAVYNAANTINNLCDSNVNSLLVRRSLFWAAMISRSPGMIPACF